MRNYPIYKDFLTSKKMPQKRKLFLYFLEFGIYLNRTQRKLTIYIWSMVGKR